MKKKALMIYRFPHHSRMMETMAELLTKREVPTDVYCIKDGKIINNTGIRNYIFFSIRTFIYNKFRPFRYRSKLCAFYDKYIMSLLFSNYYKVDFHAFYSDYIPMMEACKMSHTKYDITLWGSDVLRLGNENFETLRHGFEKCTCIRGVEKLQDKVSSVYKGLYDDKLKTAYFGNTNFKEIDKLTNKEISIDKKSLFGTDDKFIVTCGYNAKPQQQHEIIINAIAKLPVEYKKIIHIVIPMTYGNNDISYYTLIKTRLDNISVDYTILDKFLKKEELAALRFFSDITINMQVTDAFCGALQEHLYCGNIVIIGDWLSYPAYDKNNVFYLKTDADKLPNKLLSVLENYDKYHAMTNKNHRILRNIVSWDFCIEKWKLYMEL